MHTLMTENEFSVCVFPCFFFLLALMYYGFVFFFPHYLREEKKLCGLMDSNEYVMIFKL